MAIKLTPSGYRQTEVLKVEIAEFIHTKFQKLSEEDRRRFYTVILPIHMLMMAVGQTIGVGGASIISRRMGAGDDDAASLTLGNMMLLAMSFGCTFAVSDFLTFTITLLFVYRAMKSIPKSSSASIQAGNEVR